MGHPTANARHQAAFKERMRADGFVQATIWVPKAAVADLQLAAGLMRSNPKLTFASLRNPRGGRFVAIK